MRRLTGRQGNPWGTAGEPLVNPRVLRAGPLMTPRVRDATHTVYYPTMPVHPHTRYSQALCAQVTTLLARASPLRSSPAAISKAKSSSPIKQVRAPKLQESTVHGTRVPRVSRGH